MERTYRAGTRTSPLALKQAEEVLTGLRKCSPSFRAEIVGINTYGDGDRNTPISQIEGSDFFTREIEEALLRGKIDFAVHSAKDLPDIIPQRLSIAAITASIDPYDVLVSKGNSGLAELPRGAKIGTSSLRRKTQLKSYRNDFIMVDIRGNIEERLKTLDQTELDAIVIAAAGLIRLELGDRITERIPFAILKPHPLQGRLAVEVRKEDEDIIRLCRKWVLASDDGRAFAYSAKGRDEVLSARGSLAQKVNPSPRQF